MSAPHECERQGTLTHPQRGPQMSKANRAPVSFPLQVDQCLGAGRKEFGRPSVAKSPLWTAQLLSDKITERLVCFGGRKEMQDVKQSRALATRERILRAAAGLFALKGFHDTKLKEVLCSAKVTTGAFFHHFQNKDDLGFAVIDRHMERRRRQLNKIEETLPPGPDEGHADAGVPKTGRHCGNGAVANARKAVASSGTSAPR